MHYIFAKNDLDVSLDPNVQINIDTLRQLLTERYPSFRNRTVDFMGHVYATDLLAGDIIYWKFRAQQNVGLLGIVIKNEFGDPGVLLSYGSGYGNCESNYSNNLRNSRRGPRVVSLLLKNLLDYGMFSFKFG